MQALGVSLIPSCCFEAENLEFNRPTSAHELIFKQGSLDCAPPSPSPRPQAQNSGRPGVQRPKRAASSPPEQAPPRQRSRFAAPAAQALGMPTCDRSLFNRDFLKFGAQTLQLTECQCVRHMPVLLCSPALVGVPAQQLA